MEYKHYSKIFKRFYLLHSQVNIFICFHDKPTRRNAKIVFFFIFPIKLKVTSSSLTFKHGNILSYVIELTLCTLFKIISFKSHYIIKFYLSICIFTYMTKRLVITLSNVSAWFPDVLYPAIFPALFGLERI